MERELRVRAKLSLDRPAEVAQQGGDFWSEDDQASDRNDGDERNDQAVFDQALR
jgi:hypothetical protein